MSTALSNNLEKLLTLKQASEQLGVSIETLLSWNQNNILKPTITEQGEIGYTQNQLSQFLTIRQLILNPTQATPTLQQQPQIVHQIAPKPIDALPLEPHLQSVHPRPFLQEDFAHVDLKAQMETLSQVSGIKHVSPRLMVSLGIVLTVMVTIAVFPEHGILSLLPDQYAANYQKLTQNSDQVLGQQTSKLKIPGQIIATLPIQNKNDSADLQNESDLKDKITTASLYTDKPKKDLAVNNKTQIAVVPTGTQKSATALGVNDAAVSDTYGFSSVKSCSTCKPDADSAIDASGNIRGETSKTDTLASIVGGLEEIVNNDSFRQVSTDSTNQLLFLFMGTLAAVFLFQKQFAYLMKKPHAVKEPYLQPADLASQKALEVDQKTDGTVVLYFRGKEYKVSKPELSSESDQFIERLMELVQPGMKEIEYDMLSGAERLNFATPLSRLVTRLGFVGLKRDLFFPRTSKSEVLFRKYLTMQDLAGMNLTIEQILNDFSKTA